MSVHQLKDGRWIVQYRDESKKSGYAREYFGRGPDGERNARERNDELDLRSYKYRTSKTTSITFKELSQVYVQAKTGIMQESSMDALLYKLESIILPKLGHIEAIRLTPAVLDKFVSHRLQQNVTVLTGPRRNRKRTPVLDKNGQPKKITRSTVHREISDIMAIMNWAVKRKYIKTNPLANYDKPRRDDQVIEPPTIAEIQALLKHASDHIRRCLLISFYTGLRPGAKELLSLQWKSVDLQKNTIQIISARRGGPKSRIVPIHPAFRKLLKKWQSEDKDKKVPEIITYRGQPVQRIKKAFYAAKKRAGITRRLRPYDMRHAFASFILDQSGDLRSTGEIMGHSRPDTTMKHYQHTNITLHRKTIEKLPALEIPE